MVHPSPVFLVKIQLHGKILWLYHGGGRVARIPLPAWFMFTASIICHFVQWCSIGVKALNSAAVGLEGKAFQATRKDHQTRIV